MRYHEFLIRRYTTIIGYSGAIFAIIGAVLLLPLCAIFFFPEDVKFLPAFLIPGCLGMVSGLFLRNFFPPDPDADLSAAEGTAIVVVSWIFASVLGAFPFLSAAGLNWTQAVFESASGWTTTGLSVMDVGQASPVVLFYRSLLQWVGGAGFAVIMLSALAGPAGTGLAAAEGRGGQLVPNVRRSAAIVLKIYLAYTVFGIIALYFAGMSIFDAVNHAFTSVSTGGFSTRPESIAYWHSPGIEAVLIFLMILGSTNFFTAYLLFKGKLRAVGRNSEIRLALLLLLIAVPMVSFFLKGCQHFPWLESFRTAIFETVSALTTTGFTVAQYSSWGDFGIFAIILLMLVGGGTGSTAGGLKLYRIFAMFQGLVWEFKRRILPDTAVTEPDAWHGEQRHFISDAELNHAAVYVFLYLGVFAAGGLFIAWHGFGLRESLLEFASALGTVGLSMGITCASAPSGILWAQTAAMLLGRLEFFAVIVGMVKLMTDAQSLIFSGGAAGSSR